jgi:hypothetical protein
MACWTVRMPMRVRHRGGRRRPGLCVDGGVVQRQRGGRASGTARRRVDAARHRPGRCRARRACVQRLRVPVSAAPCGIARRGPCTVAGESPRPAHRRISGTDHYGVGGLWITLTPPPKPAPLKPHAPPEALRRLRRAARPTRLPVVPRRRAHWGNGGCPPGPAARGGHTLLTGGATPLEDALDADADGPDLDARDCTATDAGVEAELDAEAPPVRAPGIAPA